MTYSVEKLEFIPGGNIIFGMRNSKIQHTGRGLLSNDLFRQSYWRAYKLNAVRGSKCFGFLQNSSPPFFSSFSTEWAVDCLLPRLYQGLLLRKLTLKLDASAGISDPTRPPKPSNKTVIPAQAGILNRAVVVRCPLSRG